MASLKHHSIERRKDVMIVDDRRTEMSKGRILGEFIIHYKPMLAHVRLSNLFTEHEMYHAKIPFSSRAKYLERKK